MPVSIGHQFRHKTQPCKQNAADIAFAISIAPQRQQQACANLTPPSTLAAVLIIACECLRRVMQASLTRSCSSAPELNITASNRILRAIKHIH